MKPEVHTALDWRCRKCGTLLGIHRGESVHVKHKRAQLVVRGHVSPGQ